MNKLTKVILTIFLLCFVIGINAQINLEVVGEAKISTMQQQNAASDVVVRLSDGTLAVRDVSTITNSGSASPWYHGQDTLGGIVFYIYKGSDGLDHGLIVHKEEQGAQWQSPNSTTTGDRTWDGVFNMGLMTNSPAKTYVQGLGVDWYLPSIDELSLLWNNRFHANKGLFDSSSTLLQTTAAYWSSTESNASNAWYVSFFNGTAVTNLKSSFLNTRAIRAF